ncbi:MAG: hypothetical protein ABH878_02215 [bacterium]
MCLLQYALPLAYSIWLVLFGTPIFWMRARPPIYSRPIDLESIWFRVAGGVCVLAYLISFGSSEVGDKVAIVLWICSGLLYLYAIIKGISEWSKPI